MFARVAHKLPQWAVAYPFETFTAVVLLTTGLELFLGVVEGFRPLGGALPAWALYGLPAAQTITAVLLLLNIRAGDGRGLAGSLYTTSAVSVGYIAMLCLNGLDPNEVIVAIQAVALITLCTLRGSYLRAAYKVRTQLIGR